MRRVSETLALAWLVAGCSLTRPDVSDCSASYECRERFGFGSVCGAEGLCVTASRSARCSESYPGDLFTRPERYRDVIVLGSVVDRTLETHQARENAIRLAASEVTDYGGLEGSEFGVVFCTIEEDLALDDLDRGQAALKTSRYLVNTLGVPAIVGPQASTDAQAVFDELSGSGTLLISPSATSPTLTGIDTLRATDESPGMLWRTAPPDSIQAVTIARYLLTQGVTEVSIVAETGAYGGAMTGVFLPEYKAGGGGAEVFPFGSDAERNEAAFNAGQQAAGWVLFISSQTADAIAFLNAVSGQASYATKQLFLTDSAANADLLDQAPSEVFPQVRGSRPAIPSGSIYEQFAGSYRAEYGVDPAEYSFTPQAYDAAWLVFYGAAWSLFQEGGVSGPGIARGLRHVSQGPRVDMVPSSWPVVLQSFRSAQGIDVLGVSGPLDFDPTTEEVSADVEIWRINAAGDGFDVETTISP